MKVSRTFDVTDNEFDLASLLWGDLPLATDAPGSAPDQRGANLDASPHDPEAASHLVNPPQTQIEPGLITDLQVTDPASTSLVEPTPVPDTVREDEPAWDAWQPREAIDVLDPVDIVSSRQTGTIDDDIAPEAEDSDPLDLEVDLDALAALAELDIEDDAVTVEGSADAFGGFACDERSLSYGELTDRLHREVLPRLRWLTTKRHYLTLGDLAEAVADLQGSESHLRALRDFAERTDAAILASRTHKVGRHLPRWAIDHARRQFGDLLSEQPDIAMVVARLRYSRIPLSDGMRAFLVQAWMGHCLSRDEERHHAQTVAAEIARVGPVYAKWSSEALASREALILDNLWLVARNARPFVGHGVEIDDLIQMGVLGLLRAVEKFKPTLGYRFSTYAHWWINQAIARNIADQVRLIRLPVHAHERARVIEETREELSQALQREPTIAEIAAASGVSEGIVRGCLLTSRPLSLDDPTVRAQLEAYEAPLADPVELVEASDAAETVRQVVKTLPERERDVIELRFGLRDGEPQTLEEIGQRFNVTRERIRQIEQKALSKLRHPSRLRRIREYLPAAAPNAARKPTQPISSVTEHQVRRALVTFAEEERAVIRTLWGLDKRRRSVRETAMLHGLPVERVEQIYRQALDVARSRLDRPIPEHETSWIRRRALQHSTKSSNLSGIHPQWLLAPDDCDTMSWALRIAGKTMFPRDSNDSRRLVSPTSDFNCDEPNTTVDHECQGVNEILPFEPSSDAYEAALDAPLPCIEFGNNPQQGVQAEDGAMTVPFVSAKAAIDGMPVDAAAGPDESCFAVSGSLHQVQSDAEWSERKTSCSDKSNRSTESTSTSLLLPSSMVGWDGGGVSGLQPTEKPSLFGRLRETLKRSRSNGRQ